jgi:hypothetical protein
MCQCEQSGLSFETMFTDPLIRLVMASDGVTREDLAEVLEVARSALGAPARVIPFPARLPEMTPAGHA